MKNIYKLFQKDQLRIMGLMTGTSADELDLCLVEFTGKDKYPKFKILNTESKKMPNSLAEQFKNSSRSIRSASCIFAF